MIIYKITNLINDKFYIGKDKYNDPNYFGSGKLIKQAIHKYGIDNFKKEIIEICDSEFKLNEREIFWIKEFNAIEEGYNIAVGGEGGDTISFHPERDIISKNHSNWMKKNSSWIGRKRTKEEIEKWRKSYGEKGEGENNPMFGKNHSEKSKQLIGEKALGREVSQETIIKISKKNKGKKSKKKGIPNKNHSEWMKKNNPFKGKNHTNEVILLLSNSHKGKSKNENIKIKISESLKEFYKNGNKPINTKKIFIDGNIYNGYSEASKYLNIPISTIRNRIKSNSYPNYYHIV